jgi:hypothetical protein
VTEAVVQVTDLVKRYGQNLCTLANPISGSARVATC